MEIWFTVEFLLKIFIIVLIVAVVIAIIGLLVIFGVFIYEELNDYWSYRRLG